MLVLTDNIKAVPLFLSSVFMVIETSSIMSLLSPHTLGSFLPSLPLDSLFSTQGIMIMLLAAYAGAMWMFLSSAPKVYTVMVSDLEVARQLCRIARFASS